MSNKKSIVCIIARTNSSRLIKKALLRIGELRMIEVLIKRMKIASIPNDIYLCTSKNPADRVLVDIALNEGIKYVAGSELAVIERMLEVINKTNATDLIRVTGDNPLTDPFILDQLIEKHNLSNADYTTMRFLPRGSSSEVIKSTALKKLYLKMDPNESQYLSIYINDGRFFNCNVLDAPRKLFSPYLTFSVDTLEEFEDVSMVVKSKGYSSKTINYIEFAKNNQICNISPTTKVKLSESHQINYSDYIDWQLGKKKLEEL